MKVVTPEQWYIAFWWTLSIFMLVASSALVGLFAWFVGPFIIAKGLDLWMKGSNDK